MRKLRKVLGIALVVLCALVLALRFGLGVKLSTVLMFTQIEERKLDDRFHVFLGGGGNTAVLVTDKGTVVVDTKFGFGAKALAKALARLGPVRALINTHHHGDHSHGNPLYPAGTAVHAAAPVRELMQRFDASFWKDEPARSLMPNRLLPGTGEETVDFGEDRVRLVQLPPAHTGGGDIGVLFEKRRVLQTGDIVFSGFYPFIDQKSGGSVAGCIAAADRLLELPFDTVIPGHGPIGTRADVEKMRAYYAALWALAREAVDGGQSASQAAAGAPEVLRGRDTILGATSLKRNLEWAMDEYRRNRAK